MFPKINRYKVEHSIHSISSKWRKKPKSFCLLLPVDFYVFSIHVFHIINLWHVSEILKWKDENDSYTRFYSYSIDKIEIMENYIHLLNSRSTMKYVYAVLSTCKIHSFSIIVSKLNSKTCSTFLNISRLLEKLPKNLKVTGYCAYSMIVSKMRSNLVENKYQSYWPII